MEQEQTQQLDQAFFTDNAALAVTLMTCGATHPQNEKGEIIPCRNIYNAENLEKLGYKGWEIEQAAADAFRKKLHGLILYCFNRSDIVLEIQKGWDAQSAIIRAIDEKKDMTHGTAAGAIEIEPFDLARLCCQFAKNRRSLMEAWKYVRPTIEIQGESNTETFGEGHTRTTGSFKQYSMNPSPETRRKLEL